MAAKYIIFFAFVAVAASAAISDECICDPPAESEIRDHWEFFKKLSSQMSAGDGDVDTNLLAVLPGELSPLLECNCLENNRKKRKVQPDEEPEAPKTPEIPTTPEPVIDSIPDDEDHIPAGIERSPKCPQGYVWFGILCVDETLVLEK